jgi:hypothetical protein
MNHCIIEIEGFNLTSKQNKDCAPSKSSNWIGSMDISSKVGNLSMHVSQPVHK